MEEVVSRSKLLTWFNYFKENNPLFRDQEWHEERIDEFIKELQGDPAEQPECETTEEEHHERAEHHINETNTSTQTEHAIGGDVTDEMNKEMPRVTLIGSVIKPEAEKLVDALISETADLMIEELHIDTDHPNTK